MDEWDAAGKKPTLAELVEMLRCELPSTPSDQKAWLERLRARMCEALPEQEQWLWTMYETTKRAFEDKPARQGYHPEDED